MEVYTIYHKDGHKIGATNEYEKRIKSYPPNTTVVLVELPKDQYTPQQIGDIEWGYADDFGYPRGNHYAIAIARRSLGGIKGGKIGGRKNVESGHLASIRSVENSSKAGRKNVESGQISELGKIQGRKNVESGQLASIRTFENQSKGGKIGGKIGGKHRSPNGGKIGGKTNKGKKHFNNGITGTRAFECPEGFVPGMLKSRKD